MESATNKKMASFVTTAGMARDLYDPEFYSAYEDITLSSARRIAPILLHLVSPRSVVDVGCGIGVWLRAFSENGVIYTKGLDGEHVQTSQLLIDACDFLMVDLGSPFEISGRYDLAICLEVGEHLSSERAAPLVAALTDAAPIVLFSAAIPGQGGRNHINEQWPSYWRNLFEARKFTMLDILRPRVRNDDAVAWWYRQNIVIFANDEAINMHPGLQIGLTSHQPLGIEWVHIDLVKSLRESMSAPLDAPHPGLRRLIREVPRAFRASVRRSLGKPR
jgi:SAM-dependent methyltransferase